MEETPDNMMLPNFNVNEYIPEIVQVEPSASLLNNLIVLKKNQKIIVWYMG